FCDFFFQAEDGIRDFHVTGVQTCALPIFGPGSTVDHTAWPRCDAIDPHQWDPSASRKGERSRPLPFRPLAAQTQALDQLAVAVRSEERRVGKESRARRVALHMRTSRVSD